MIEPQNRNVGSAATLEGTIYVLVFYVGTPSSPITEREACFWGSELLEAERWLTGQAVLYGKKVAFVNASYGMDGSLVIDNIPASHETPNAFFFPEKVYQKQNFPNGWALSEYIRNTSGCQQWMTLILCNTKGRCFACPVSDKLFSYDNHKFFLESCVVFRYEPVDYQMKTTSASIAHEMLHLFGASDLYSLSDADRYVEAMSRRLYPKSIMLGHTEGLQNNEVDEITAWLVGWRGQVL